MFNFVKNYGIKYKSMNINNLLTRSLSGIIYIGIIIGAIIGGEKSITVLIMLLTTLGCIEFSKMNGLLIKRNYPALILDIAGCISFGCIPLCESFIVIWVAIMLLRIIEELYLKMDNPLKNISHSLMSQIYIGMPMAAMNFMAVLTDRPQLLMLIFIFIWIYDTGAFIVGSTIGKHRLFERVSPKKSWEGLWGGLLFNLVTASILCFSCSAYFGLPNNIKLWCGLAIVVSLFATWGDLIESLIKRHLGIKDSGNLIPGHGGILDRIDSLLLVAPASALFLAFYLAISQ